MPDSSMPGDAPEHLSNSQIEAQAGNYDPELFGQELSEDQFNQLPDWRKRAMHRMAVRRNEAAERAAKAEGAVDQMRRELAELKANFQNGQSKVAEPEPQGWEAVKTPKLEEFVTLAEKTMHAALLNPDNEELKKQAATIDPQMLAVARRELAKRDAQGSIAEKEKSWEEAKAKERAVASLQQRLRNDFGDAIFNPKSDLMREAAQELQSMSEERQLFGESAAIYMAVERANKKLRPERRMNGSDLARLQIEGEVRREASPLNEIEALRARGDWRSRGQAVDKSIDLFIKQIGFDQA